LRTEKECLKLVCRHGLANLVHYAGLMAYGLTLVIAFKNQWPLQRLLRWVATVAVISVLLLLPLVGLDKGAGVSRILLVIVLGIGLVVLYSFRWPDSS
jgi:hypothetical protein